MFRSMMRTSSYRWRPQNIGKNTLKIKGDFNRRFFYSNWRELAGRPPRVTGKISEYRICFPRAAADAIGLLASRDLSPPYPFQALWVQARSMQSVAGHLAVPRSLEVLRRFFKRVMQMPESSSRVTERCWWATPGISYIFAFRVGNINVKERRCTWLHSWPRNEFAPLEEHSFLQWTTQTLLEKLSCNRILHLFGSLCSAILKTTYYIPFNLLGCLYLDLLNRLCMHFEL